jgi:hypothetical protein
MLHVVQYTPVSKLEYSAIMKESHQNTKHIFPNYFLHSTENSTNARSDKVDDLATFKIIPTLKLGTGVSPTNVNSAGH